MVAMINEALGKRRRYGEPSTRAPPLKRACFVKNGYRLVAVANIKRACFVKNGYRLVAVANMSAIFNKLFMFVLCYWKISLTF